MKQNKEGFKGLHREEFEKDYDYGEKTLDLAILKDIKLFLCQQIKSKDIPEPTFILLATRKHTPTSFCFHENGIRLNSDLEEDTSWS